MDEATAPSGMSRTPTIPPSRVSAHLAWYIYAAAKELQQPFSIEELQEAICRETDRRPHVRTILDELHDFYREREVPLLMRVEPDDERFLVNPSINPDTPSYRSILRPPQGHRGVPRKHATEEERKRYLRHYYRLRRNPERYLAKIFDSTDRASAEEIASTLPEMMEDSRFPVQIVHHVLGRYVQEGRGPPYLRELKGHVYRKIKAPSQSRRYLHPLQDGAL